MKNTEMITDAEKYRGFLKSLRTELAELLKLSDEELETRAIGKSILDDIILKLHIPDAGIQTTSPEAQKRLLELMGIDLIKDVRGSLQPKERRAGKERKIRQITKVDALIKAKILEECQKLTDDQIYAFALGFSMAKLSEVNDNLDLRKHHAKIEASNHAKKNYSGDMREFIENTVEVFVAKGFAQEVVTKSGKTIKTPNWKTLITFLVENEVTRNPRYDKWQLDGNLGAIYRDTESGSLRKIKYEMVRSHIVSAMKKIKNSKT